MGRIQKILKHADATLDDIVKVVIYVTDMSLEPELNAMPLSQQLEAEHGISRAWHQELLIWQLVLPCSGVYKLSVPEPNETYPTFFNGTLPVREAVCVTALPLGAQIEISVIAADPEMTALQVKPRS